MDAVDIRIIGDDNRTRWFRDHTPIAEALRKRQVSQGLSEEEYIQLSDLSEMADKMADRIKTLEAILDAETPDWRSKL